MIRFIGITGHGTQVAATHRRSLTRFDFDSVLLPYNYLTYQNPYYAENFDALYNTCMEQNIAVQTIKSIGYRPWMGRDRTATTWYQPLGDAAEIKLAIDWALGRDDIFVNSVGDVDLLPHVLNAAEHYERMTSEGEMQALVKKLQMEPLFV